MAQKLLHFGSLALMLAGLMLLAGCNIFSTMHAEGKETNAHVLVADGQAAMRRGEYAKANEYFYKAAESNLRDSEARVGYAESFLRMKGFSLGEFVNTFLKAVKKDSISGGLDFYNLIVPEQWGATTKSEALMNIQTLIYVLDAITQGQTDGPYQSYDVNINLTVAVLYSLSAVAQVELLPQLYALRVLQKSSPQVQAAIDPLILALLPDEFLWLSDAAGNPFTPSAFAQIRSDIHSALTRVQVAADHSASKDMLKDVVETIADWDKIANP